MCITRIDVSADVYHKNTYFHKCASWKYSFPHMCIIRMCISVDVYHKNRDFRRCALPECSFLQMYIIRICVSADVHFHGCAPTLLACSIWAIWQTLPDPASPCAMGNNNPACTIQHGKISLTGVRCSTTPSAASSITTSSFAIFSELLVVLSDECHKDKKHVTTRISYMVYTYHWHQCHGHPAAYYDLFIEGSTWGLRVSNRWSRFTHSHVSCVNQSPPWA